jgi:hypothetical protein
MQGKRLSRGLESTNVEDLLDDGVENNSDIHARAGGVQSKQEPKAETVRHTVDPARFVYFEADIADAITGKYSNKRTRFGGWLFLGVPSLVGCVATIFIGFKLIFTSRSFWEFVVMSILTLVGFAASAYWPYILLKDRSNK